MEGTLKVSFTCWCGTPGLYSALSSNWSCTTWSENGWVGNKVGHDDTRDGIEYFAVLDAFLTHCTRTCCYKLLLLDTKTYRVKFRGLCVSVLWAMPFVYG